MEDISTEEKYTLSPEEPVFLRLFDINNPSDIEAYKAVDREPDVRFWMDEDPIETDEEITKHLSNTTEFLVIAICSKTDSRIVGWVQFMYDDPYHTSQLKGDGKVFGDFTDIIEISYARHTNSPDTAKGLVSSGVRQACQIFCESFKHVFPDKKLISSGNLPREKEETSDFSPKSLIITAYTDIENVPSERVLEKSFFTKVHEVFYYEDEPDVKDNLWVLDIKKLHNNFPNTSKILLPDEVIKQFVRN